MTTRIDVDTANTYQEIVGFGAAITDASAWLIQTRLSPAQRDVLLQDLFSSSGIGLSFTRLTIGASDFSRAHYSFDDVPAGETDPTLTRFSIGPNIGTTRGWAKGVLLWNLALDETTGHIWGGCGDCRGVVTINSRTGEVTRDEEYYALAHASRFVRPLARRIASTTGVDGLETVAFRNADDGSKVLVVVNTAPAERTFAVRSGGRSFRSTLPAGAVMTLRWG